jgi:hypothetical protein
MGKNRQNPTQAMMATNATVKISHKGYTTDFTWTLFSPSQIYLMTTA